MIFMVHDSHHGAKRKRKKQPELNLGLGVKGKRSRKAKPAGTWAAHSVPQEKDEVPDVYADSFAGDRTVIGTSRLPENYVRREDRLPANFPLLEATLDGYYLCYSPCHHVQTIGEGEVCGRCGKTMRFIQDVEPV